MSFPWGLWSFESRDNPEYLLKVTISDCNCGGTPAPFLTVTVSGSTTTNCDYTAQPTASSCPAPSTTPPPPTKTPNPPITSPPPAPSGTISCGGGSPNIATDSISALLGGFCGGNANYDPGAATVVSSQPWADLSDIPDELKKDQILNNIYVTLITDRPNCYTATFDFSASSSLCQAYLASITASCTQGGGVLASAGCFDWGVKAFTLGSGEGTWSTAA